MKLKEVLISILANKQGEFVRKPTINKEVFINADKIGKYYTAESVGRELRKLTQKGIIERNPNEFHAQYRYKGGF